jgi:hypothetical protein
LIRPMLLPLRCTATAPVVWIVMNPPWSIGAASPRPSMKPFGAT